MHPAIILRYLRMPLHSAPLVLILLFGFVLTLAEHAGVFGIPAFVIIGSWFFKYGFALLDHVVDGRPEAPVLSVDLANPIDSRPLGTFLLLIFFHSGIDVLHLNIIISTVLRLMLLVAVPAMIAAMSITGQFISALNPKVVLGIIVRIPAAYFMLLLTIIGLWLVPVLTLRSGGDSLAALWRIESFLPGETLVAVGVSGALIGMFGQMLFMYLWLTTFALIGGTIYEQRGELGIEVVHSPERKAARANADLERERDKIWDRVFAQVRGGALEGARESVRNIIEASRQPLDECRWLYARASALADQRLPNYLAQLILRRLLDAQATGEALDIVCDRLKMTSDFRPHTSEQALRLAQLARDAGNRSVARQLLADFERCYPDDPMNAAAVRLLDELQH